MFPANFMKFPISSVHCFTENTHLNYLRQYSLVEARHNPRIAKFYKIFIVR